MDELNLIIDSAREVLAKEFDARRLHAFIDGKDDAAEQLWQLAIDMGWLGASTPERLGGLGLAPVASFAILKECGRRAVPGPIMPALVAAVWAAGLEDGSVLEVIGADVAAGNLRLLLPAFDWRGAVNVNAQGVLQGSLSGMIGWQGANAALVPAIHEGRRAVVLAELAADGNAFHPQTLWDKTRQAGTASFDGARVIGMIADEDGSQLARLRTVLLLAIAGDSMGGAENALAISTAYTKERYQFGRPVGSFQALKHRMSSMHVNILQGARLYQFAADLYSQGGADAAQWAMLAKAEACEVFAQAAEESILLHGGVGYTWEFDPHIYAKRSRLNAYAGGESRSLRNEAWSFVMTASDAGRSTAEIAA